MNIIEIIILIAPSVTAVLIVINLILSMQIWNSQRRRIGLFHDRIRELENKIANIEWKFNHYIINSEAQKRENK